MRKEEEARVDFWVGGRNKEREGSGGTIMKCFPFFLLNSVVTKVKIMNK